MTCGTDFSFDVVIDGRAAEKYYHERRTYVVAQRGKQYSLRFRNHTWRRVLAVPTVDGLSAMNGQEGSYDSGGYVVSPYGSLEIDGFRLNDESVAAFTFGDRSDSYASKMGKPLNVGVIGLAVFYEDTPPPNPWPYTPPLWWQAFPDNLRPYLVSYDSGSVSAPDGGTFRIWPTPSEVKTSGSLSYTTRDCYHGPGILRSQSAGTSFGSVQESRVMETTFLRSPSPVVVLELHYDYLGELVRKGVLPCHCSRPNSPVPFPAITGCTPPSGWVG